MSTSRHLREILSHDLHLQMRHFLNALQHVEPAPAAIALHRIGRIGHHLQLVQHELRDHQNAVEKTGIGDIGDAAVDDDAGVEDLLIGAAVRLGAEQAAQRGQIQQIALGRAGDRADVGKQQQADDLSEVQRVRIGRPTWPRTRLTSAAQNSPATMPNTTPIRRSSVMRAMRRSRMIASHASAAPTSAADQKGASGGRKISGGDAQNQNEYSPKNNKIQHAPRPPNARCNSSSRNCTIQSAGSRRYRL